MDELINSMGDILSQCVRVWVVNHCIVYYKYLTILFVNFTLEKVKKQNKKLFPYLKKMKALD